LGGFKIKMAKPIQYCKVKKMKINKISFSNLKKNYIKIQGNGEM